MITGRDIVITGLQAWDIEIGSNCKNIALEFSKHNRVLYVNAPMTRTVRIRERHDPRIQKRERILKGKEPALVQLKENLWNLNPPVVIESINQLGINFLFDWLNKINNQRIAREIKKAMDSLGFKNHIHFCDSDMFRSFYLKELLHPDLYVYYTRDNLVSMPYWKKQGVRIEALHMAKADLVVANSTYLAQLASRFNPNSHYVGQGCDTSAFDISKVKNIPEDIKGIPKPIIGYIGALTTARLDIQILEIIASYNKDWSLVLVGPEDNEFKSSELHRYDNVYFLGNKDGSVLPSYLAAFDVAINPQKITPLTIGNYPRKIDEYLAMGKAVVATRTEAMSIFEDYCFLADKADDYPALIEKALQSNEPEIIQKRIDYAKSHTWENNVKEIYKYMELTLKNKTHAN